MAAGASPASLVLCAPWCRGRCPAPGPLAADPSVFPRGQLCPAHRESHRVLARQLAFDRVRSALPQSVAPDHTEYCKPTELEKTAEARRSL